MAENKVVLGDDINLLFQRPNEPLFTVKDNGKTVFELPPEFYTERYKTIGATLASRLGEDVERTIQLREITPPNVDFAHAVHMHGPFSLFNRTHQQVAGQLIKIFLDSPASDFISTAAFVKDRVNPYLFLVNFNDCNLVFFEFFFNDFHHDISINFKMQYSLATAVQHRKDTRHVSLPSIVQQFPDQFVDSSVFPRAREEGTLVPAGNRIPIEIEMNFTASDREQEQRLAYFREDIGVNMHHWHWHLVNGMKIKLKII